jgi:hypothetical protein
MFGIRGVGVRAADDLLGGMRGMSLTKPANLPSLSTRQPYNLFPLCNHNTNWIVQYSTQLLYTIQVGIHRALSIRYLGNPSFTSRAPFSTSPKRCTYHTISFLTSFSSGAQDRQASGYVMSCLDVLYHLLHLWYNVWKVAKFVKGCIACA